MREPRLPLRGPVRGVVRLVAVLVATATLGAAAARADVWICKERKPAAQDRRGAWPGDVSYRVTRTDEGARADIEVKYVPEGQDDAPWVPAFRGVEPTITEDGVFLRTRRSDFHGNFGTSRCGAYVGLLEVDLHRDGGAFVGTLERTLYWDKRPGADAPCPAADFTRLVDVSCETGH
jgi:hypothetical protein